MVAHRLKAQTVRRAAKTVKALEAVADTPAATSAPQAGLLDGADGKRSLIWDNNPAANMTLGYGLFNVAPGSEISRERPLGAALAKEMVSSNPQIATICENLPTLAVGNGLTLSSRPDAKALGIAPEVARELSDDIEREWQAWASDPMECDATARHNVHQMAFAGFKSWLLTGELAFLLDWQTGGGAVSRTKVRLLDSFQIDMSISRQHDNGCVFQGVQFDKSNRVVGYWVRQSALGNIRQVKPAVFVKARTSWGRERAVLLFDLLGPGQVRGLTPLIAALPPAQAKAMLREYTQAQALVQAMLAATIESDLPNSVALNGFATEGQFGVPSISPETMIKSRNDYYTGAKIDLTAGKVGQLHPGDRLHLHRSEGPNSTYDPFDASMGRDVAKAAGANVEDTSGDFSKSNFSSARLAGDLPHRITKRRRAAIAERFYSSIFRAWLEEACETGRIKLPHGAPQFWENPAAYAKCAWHGEGVAVADKLKSVQADLLEVENGFSTYEEKLAERGKDLETTLRQRKAEREMFEAAGLQYPAPKSQLVIEAGRSDDDQVLS